MRILTVVGARPQFVKAAVLSRNIAETEGIEEILVHTGQHFDQNMSDIFFEEMAIPKPDHNLHINGLTHGKMTGRMLEGLEQIIMDENPDLVLVYGDTNSTLAGALAAAKLHVPVAHVEAGLRSFNMQMPEEINRILTDRISNWLFCPTDQAMANLKSEGYEQFTNLAIQNVGDIMYDAIRYYSTLLDSRPSRLPALPDQFTLATMHRQENVQDPVRLKALVEGLNQIHQELIPVVLPLHPGTAKRIENAGLKLEASIIDPQGYFDMLRMLSRCSLVVTDSGGLQKEAYLFEKYCITMRDQTEWVELVKEGVNQLVGADREKLVHAASIVLNQTFPASSSLYGDGTAGMKILQHIRS